MLFRKVCHIITTVYKVYQADNYKEETIVFGHIRQKIILGTLCLALSGCYLRTMSFKDFVSNPLNEQTIVENQRLRQPNSVVVCRSKQCAPAELSMSREYIHNSLLHLFQNNSRKTALVCEADPSSHICLENYIQLPITSGITQAYFYVDSAKITDVTVARGNQQINIVLNYNVSFNGQTPDCLAAKTILFAKSISNIIMEDSGYMCKMNAVGQTTIKTVFSIDYIDLDYGYIGGYYSIGLSGPTYGGGTGYMLLRMPEDAYPLAPTLKANSRTAKMKTKAEELLQQEAPESDGLVNSNVKIFPIKN